jgi:hypothetical protein
VRAWTRVPRPAGEAEEAAWGSREYSEALVRHGCARLAPRPPGSRGALLTRGRGRRLCGREARLRLEEAGGAAADAEEAEVQYAALVDAMGRLDLGALSRELGAERDELLLAREEIEVRARSARTPAALRVAAARAPLGTGYRISQLGVQVSPCGGFLENQVD